MIRKNIVVGSLVLDTRTNKVGVVIKENVVWVDSDKQTHTWDYEIISGEETIFADFDEIKLV